MGKFIEKITKNLDYEPYKMMYEFNECEKNVPTLATVTAPPYSRAKRSVRKECDINVVPAPEYSVEQYKEDMSKITNKALANYVAVDCLLRMQLISQDLKNLNDKLSSVKNKIFYITVAIKLAVISLFIATFPFDWIFTVTILPTMVVIFGLSKFVIEPKFTNNLYEKIRDLNNNNNLASDLYYQSTIMAQEWYEADYLEIHEYKNNVKYIGKKPYYSAYYPLSLGNNIEEIEMLLSDLRLRRGIYNSLNEKLSE